MALKSSACCGAALRLFRYLRKFAGAGSRSRVHDAECTLEEIGSRLMVKENQMHVASQQLLQMGSDIAALQKQIDQADSSKQKV